MKFQDYLPMKNKETKNTAVPKLRFPEFKCEPEWAEYTLDEISERIDKKVGNLSLITVSITAGTGFVTQVEKFSRDISGEQYKNYIVLKEGEFAYNKGNSKKYPQGCIYKLRKFQQVAVPNAFICFRFNRNFVSDFYQGYFDNNYHGKQLQKFITSGARSDGLLNINPNDFFSIVLPTPTKKQEQQKIADCLSSIDDLISAKSRKLKALKTYKKGLMQQLFPAEGKTVPKLRFPEFRDAGKWDKKLIEDFFWVGSSKRVLQENWIMQGVPFYRTRELVSLSKNEPFKSEVFISEDLFYEVSEKYGLPTEGDFLISGVGTLGVAYQVQVQDRFYFKDGNVLWFKLKSGIVSKFFKYCFEADEIQYQIFRKASISTVGTYTIQNAKATRFSCPSDIEEQQKIADCLSSIDDFISAQSRKLELLKAHKKGLMQQLFPDSNTITK
jgi:type I restriction enzyme S subunit